MKTPMRPGGSSRSWLPRFATRASGTCTPSSNVRSIAVLARMETAGIKVDVELLRKLGREFSERMSAIEAEVYIAAGRPFNINSGPQLRQVLFDELKLPSLQKTPGGEQSTAQEVLEALARDHPLPALLLRHRQLSKLKSTYLDALPELVHARRRSDPCVVQSGSRSDRPALLRATRIFRISRCGPRRAGRFARLSSPAFRAGGS